MKCACQGDRWDGGSGGGSIGTLVKEVDSGGGTGVVILYAWNLTFNNFVDHGSLIN